ncbi:hypothetical protein [Nocardioides convexus]|uniref:hypothetical protein n=1 Tax=Nocardioides convexus TaxID=2712224 RepID=UPI0024187F39|nr:hypothetical protein [Nocardioides convexus]
MSKHAVPAPCAAARRPRFAGSRRDGHRYVGGRHRGDRDRREARGRHRRRRRPARRRRGHHAGLRGLGVQRGRGRRGALDQPLSRGRQPGHGPGGRRGDSPLRPIAPSTGSWTCCRRPSGSTGPRACTAPRGSSTARAPLPRSLEFVEIEAPVRPEVPEDEVTLYAAARLDGNEVVVIGRRGGPEFADSEIARLGHLCGLANTIATAND